jgi:hypothetical protein
LARSLALLLVVLFPVLSLADDRPFDKLRGRRPTSGDHLPTLGTRSVTLPKGVGEVGLGYRNTAGDYTFDLDGSRITGRSLVPFRAYRELTAFVGGAYGITDALEMRFEVPYVWRTFTIDRGSLIDAESRLIQYYPDSRTRGLGDARFGARFALHRYWGLDLDWKSASGADNFFPTRVPGARPLHFVGSGQSDLALRVLWDRRYRKVRLTADAGYRLRLGGISNYLLREYNPADELVAGVGAFWQPGRTWGAGLATAYLHEASATSVSVLEARATVWAEAGPVELRAAYGQPVYGKDYPALFPAQLAAPAPLLGRAMELNVVYRWR